MLVVSYLALATTLASTSGVAASSLFTPRDPPAVCSNLHNQELKVRGHDYGTYTACLCTDNLSYFLSTNLVALSAISATSYDVVANSVKSDINNGLNRVGSCPSPSQRKRSPADIARFEHRCEFGLTKCGIYSAFSSSSLKSPLFPGGFINTDGGVPTKNVKNNKKTKTKNIVEPYECVDTRTNLESCGGCVVPYSLGSTSKEVELGVDCTTLPGVSDVGCHRGKCIVRKCRKGYQLAVKEREQDEGVLMCVPVNKDVDFEGELHQQIGGTLAWKKDDA